MPKKEVIDAKAKRVEAVTEQFNNATTAIVVNYRGLNVAEVTDLRKQLRDAGVSFSVIKNNIAVRASKEAGYEELGDLFKGPTAVAFSDEDPIAPAKVLKHFADNTEAVEIKGGILENKIATLQEIDEFASLPSRDESISILASMLQSPVRKFAIAVKAVAEKGDGDAA
ncbi:50S ribosomal protein L10 [Apilactobacillus kunkeei]|uniref:Large ribosomal subunit protein uL10 n=2 Tax=Apilactobacillus kunkeei TaxID=148814 RepID=A0A0N0CQB0_9LACO|nr:50S ribosomal protein L10 [Apilactobacillus kunkeei]KOY70234.1 50S ribosomal protein L10 [Apilactobacillus kunkeei]KOY73492.1 50S ribosomal protein L10 [Apilactobacillus kunkeei DSM 12361 = ATCC 700308]KPN83375.1 50S ribosomal protein L10 [Apilactobacillus kunkeei]KPN83507.1 50S ribosomal protein L10 [Apilactobacillus kunkeei]KRK25083.1 50s ribosomal protein l10 [Apilactobacillus kunkeei DSM 12361 = ATCC 700308]